MLSPRWHQVESARVVAVAVIAVVALVAASCGQGGEISVGEDRDATPRPGEGVPDGAAPGEGGGDAPAIETIPGMPPVIDPTNLYSEIRANNLAPGVEGHRYLVYVPNERSGSVTVIDPTTYQVIDAFETGFIPQHVVPSFDLQTLYVLNNNGDSITPIDPVTGKPGKNMAIDNPYNLYWTPDSSSAMVVAEGQQRLYFRDPHTLEVQDMMQTECDGLNHVDFSIDGAYLVATCEFEGSIIKVDWRNREMVAKIAVDPSHVVSGGYKPFPMPQDVRISPDGSTYYVADMISNGIHVIDGETFTQTGFIPTGRGAHGLYPSRDGRLLYIVNRGSNTFDVVRGEGSISILDFATNEVLETVPIPDGGSPDMGNFTPDGTELWLGGRYDAEVYVFNTVSKTFTHRIPVGQGPHGLTIWPQPGRYSLGHTGNMR